MFWSYFSLLASVVTAAHAIMVESVDGSFVPWRVAPRAPTNGSGLAVRLTNYNDVAYLATVLMGTPQQQVAMSASLSQNYISVASPPPGSNNATYYSPGSSTSYVPRNDVATIQTVSGRNFSGRFSGEICSLKSTSKTFVYNASIVLTDSTVTNDLYPNGSMGILGYGVNAPTGSPPNASLINTYIPSNFTYAVCGIEINHMDDPVPDGILTMGAVDSTGFTGDFANAMVPSDSQTSWSVPFDRLTYLANGTAQNTSGLVASIDIIHTGIQVPTDMAREIYSGVPGCQAVSATLWSLPCNSTFPITLTFSGKPFTISERDTIRRLSNGTCYGVVTGGAQSVAQVGAPFLRNVYTQFGAQKASNGSVTFFVGFATKNLRQSLNTTAVASSPTNTATSGAAWVFARDFELSLTLLAASVVSLLL